MLLIFLSKFLPVTALAVISPAKSAPPTPAVTISCPVKKKFFISVLGFKKL